LFVCFLKKCVEELLQLTVFNLHQFELIDAKSLFACCTWCSEARQRKCSINLASGRFYRITSPHLTFACGPARLGHRRPNTVPSAAEKGGGLGVGLATPPCKKKKILATETPTGSRILSMNWWKHLWCIYTFSQCGVSLKPQVANVSLSYLFVYFVCLFSFSFNLRFSFNLVLSSLSFHFMSFFLC
jgi:hypothetical protein